MWRIARAVVTLAAIGLVFPGKLWADQIPYVNVGQYNEVTYSFVATRTGDVTAYFAGSDAAYENRIGLLVNGILTPAGYGLDDHSSYIGQSFDFGHVNAGDSLVFDLQVLSLGDHVYSDPSLNIPFDNTGDFVGHNHVYSTTYTATAPVFGSTPPGTYVAFEDERFPQSDFSYADENFVFTNVTNISAVPAPGGLVSLAIGSLCVFGYSRRR